MDDLDYLFVLKALNEIPFGVGKNLLIDVLQGNKNNSSVIKNNLDKLQNFATLAYTKEELKQMINKLILNNLISQKQSSYNKFVKLLELSPLGLSEIENPSLNDKKVSNNFKFEKTIITDADKEIFKAFSFLDKFNDEQKKAIISNKDKILCVAGAGSGKTTVLTQRIDFLIKYKSVDPKKVLAITFTKKARQEMMSRIENKQVQIETFNSFCERILRANNDLIYDKQVRVISYKDKIKIVRSALNIFNITMYQATRLYFSAAQRRGKTDEKLTNIFINDLFFLRSYFKLNNQEINSNAFEIPLEYKRSFQMVLDITRFIQSYMIKHGLRDFTDQLIDTINFFEKYPEKIPKYEYILIDEYQDVNSTQIKLIDILNVRNIFAVGDPRQSIYGWRGSNIKYILSFKEKYPNCEIITLTKNYRSTKHIVDLINESIKDLKLPNLENVNDGEKKIYIKDFNTQKSELEFVLKKIEESDINRKEIFVLARTNKILNTLSDMLKEKKIAHILKNEDTNPDLEARENQITLATIHSIKGMEAKLVFLINSTPSNFPCKGSDHPIIDLIKIEDYDKEEEEKRLFYVGLSRAKEILYVTYTKKHTYFLTEKMKKIAFESSSKKLQDNSKKLELIKIEKSNNPIQDLKNWRKEVANMQKVPAYVIMHDKTLEEIANRMPTNLIQLQMIKGMGPNKVVKYGDQILMVLNG